jgi:hypothetical protein
LGGLDFFLNLKQCGQGEPRLNPYGEHVDKVDMDQCEPRFQSFYDLNSIIKSSSHPTNQNSNTYI